MHTVDGQFTTENSFLNRFRRDLRLLLRIIKMLLSYFIVGGRIRRTYRLKESRGESFWVDEELKR